MVSVSLTDRELLEWIRSRLGSSIIQKRTCGPNHKISYDWKLADRRAIEFLKIVRSFLVIQRKIARCNLLLTV